MGCHHHPCWDSTLGAVTPSPPSSVHSTRSISAAGNRRLPIGCSHPGNTAQAAGRADKGGPHSPAPSTRCVCCTREPGMISLASSSPTAECQPCTAPGVSCAHGAACRGDHGTRDLGTLASRTASPVLGCHGAGLASRTERSHGGSQCAGMV